MTLLAILLALGVPQDAAAEQIARLIRDLGADRLEVREGATRELMDAGAQAVAALKRAAAGPDPEVVDRATLALRCIEAGMSGRVWSRFSDLMPTGIPDRKWWEGVAARIERLADSTPPPPLVLLTDLLDVEWDVLAETHAFPGSDYPKEALRRALAKADRKTVIAELLKRLISGSDAGRSRALDALAELGDPSLLPDVVAVLRQTSWQARTAALRFLARHGTRGASDLGQVVTPLLSDANEFVRHEAIETLGRLGDIRARPTLLAVLDRADAGDRLKAIGALGDLGDRRAIPKILPFLNDSDPLFKCHAALALAALEAPEAAAALIRLLREPDSRADFNAWSLAEGLGRSAGHEDMAGIVAMLRDRDAVGYAVRALMCLRHNETIPDLIALLDGKERILYHDPDHQGAVAQERSGSIALRALKALSGKSFDTPGAWTEWWEKNRESLPTRK